MKIAFRPVTLFLCLGLLLSGCGGSGGSGVTKPPIVTKIGPVSFPAGFLATSLLGNGDVLLLRSDSVYSWNPETGIKKLLFSLPTHINGLVANDKGDIFTGAGTFLAGSSVPSPDPKFLGYFGNFNNTFASFINFNSGPLGFAEITYNDNVFNAKSWTNIGSFVPPFPSESFPIAEWINNAGDIVGEEAVEYTISNPARSFLTKKNGRSVFLASPGGQSSGAFHINEEGVISGTVLIKRINYPCIWTKGIPKVFLAYPNTYLIGTDAQGNSLAITNVPTSSNHYIDAVNLPADVRGDPAILKNGKLTPLSVLYPGVNFGIPIKITEAGRIMCKNAVVDAP